MVSAAPSCSSEGASPAMSSLANRVGAAIPDKWKKVAFQLALDRGVIKAIEHDEHECFYRFMAVMYHWKQSLSKPFTWATLVAALQSRSVGETRLAEELRKEFCTI